MDESDPIDRAIRNLWLCSRFQHGERHIVIACLSEHWIGDRLRPLGGVERRLALSARISRETFFFVIAMGRCAIGITDCRMTQYLLLAFETLSRNWWSEAAVVDRSSRNDLTRTMQGKLVSLRLTHSARAGTPNRTLMARHR